MRSTALSSIVVFSLAGTLLSTSCSDKKEGKATQPSGAAASEGDKAPGTAPPAPAAPAADNAEAMGEAACKLLTQAEAAEILGQEVEPGKPGMFSCQWATAKGLPLVMVELRGKSAYDMAREMEPKAEELADIGEKAFYGTTAGDHVVFVKGDKYVHIAILGDIGGDPKKQVIDWAKKLAGRS